MTLPDIKFIKGCSIDRMPIPLQHYLWGVRLRYPDSPSHGRDHIIKTLLHCEEFFTDERVELTDRAKWVTLAGATFHDYSLTLNETDRENHHEDSAKWVLEQEAELHDFFSPDEVRTIAECCRCHRSSVEMCPNISVEAKIVHDADGAYDITTLLKTAIRYNLEKDYPREEVKRIDREGFIALITDVTRHCIKKYGSDGYGNKNLYFNPPPKKLKEARELMARQIGEPLFEYYVTLITVGECVDYFGSDIYDELGLFQK